MHIEINVNQSINQLLETETVKNIYRLISRKKNIYAKVYLLCKF